LAVIFTVISCFKLYDRTKFGAPERKIRKRLFWFAIVYIINWTGAITVRLGEEFSNWSPSDAMMCWHHVMYYWGIFNFIVWINSENFYPICCRKERQQVN